MEHKPALYALIDLHAELGGKIKDNARQAQQLRASMKHVEHVLKPLEPSFNARSISVRRRYNPNPIFKRGTVFRAALEIMRASGVPMTADEISLALYRSKGVENPSREDMRHMWGAVSKSMQNHKGKTVVGDNSRPQRWALVPAQLNG